MTTKLSNDTLQTIAIRDQYMEFINVNQQVLEDIMANADSPVVRWLACFALFEYDVCSDIDFSNPKEDEDG